MGRYVPEKGVHFMNHGRLQTYAFSVCFLSLICGAIATGLFLFNFVKILAPDSTISPNVLAKYSSIESFLESSNYLSMSVPRALSNNPPISQPDVFAEGDTVITSQQPLYLSDKEIEPRRLKQLKSVYSNHRFIATQGIIFQSIIMLICSIVFLIHWRLTKRVGT